jgi:hypothetical protein
MHDGVVAGVDDADSVRGVDNAGQRGKESRGTDAPAQDRNHAGDSSAKRR